MLRPPYYARDPRQPEIGTADVETAIECVRKGAKKHVARCVAENSKLDLLVGRPCPERGLEDAWGHAPVMTFRTYLRVKVPECREALTKLLLSEHGLAVERLRYEGVDSKQRLCRHCRLEVEDPVHVLLVCTERQELVDLRRAFFDDIVLLQGQRGLDALMELELKQVIQHLASMVSTVNVFARYVRNVLRMFDGLPFVGA